MTTTVMIALVAIVCILLIILVLRMNALDKQQYRQETMLRETLNQLREETTNNLHRFESSVNERMTASINFERSQFDTFSQKLIELTTFNQNALERIRETLDRNLKSIQDDTREHAKVHRDELGKSLKSFEERLETMRQTIEREIRRLQEDNAAKLDKMRETVDEKLQSTLEKRLSESFKQVSEQLESVYRGLGEMKNLASGVDDLKRVLVNVKTRGTWGEIQLDNLLAQLLTAEQYDKNVVTKPGATERVEFAIKLPGRDRTDTVVYLPVDAKFPQEDYQRLLEAQTNADVKGIEDSRKAIERRIVDEAKKIGDKYLEPPFTTDFAIMFLPVEGLYAEVLSISGLWEKLQRDLRVIITGPTTLAAILNSLQMGFRTLAIEKRSSDVWSLLGSVKTEFGKFGDLLDKTQKKLQEASTSLESAQKGTRTIEKKLNAVQSLPTVENQSILPGIETIES